jgi:hypothetical protein
VLIAIVYLSTATRPYTTAMLEALLQDARSFNEKVGVTGVLLYRDGFFFQYIEGIEKNLEEVYQRIERSTGHNRIYVLLNAKVQHREFEKWHMGFFEALDGTFLYLSEAFWNVSLSSLEQSTVPKSEGLLFLHSFIKDWQKAN